MKTKLVLSVFLLVAFLVSCRLTMQSTQVQEVPLDSPTVSQQPIVTKTFIPTITPSPLPLELSDGIIIIRDYEGIYRYDIFFGKYEVIDSVDSYLYEEAKVAGEEVYFVRASPAPRGYAGWNAGNVFRITIDGKNLAQITYTDVAEYNLSVSADGSHYAFCRDNIVFDDPARYQLFLVDSISGRQQVINQSANSCAGFLAWSPDSQKLAYIDGNTDETDHNLLVYDVNNQKVTQIYRGTTTTSQFAWSPDGNSIILAFENEGKNGIGLFNFATNEVQMIANISKLPANFVWSPTGKNVLFEISAWSKQGATHFNTLHLLDIDSGKITKLYSYYLNNGYHSFNAQWSLDGKLIEYAYTDTNDVWKIIVYDTQTKEVSEIVIPEHANCSADYWKIIEQD